ncbi:MAG: adenosylcobalamin-dependent ribonucleoside-diphosphate reductase [Gammaproteobacteria bacterium]|nr:adenosylcobalamin-dependent ribonucleoside-diphosphate reductase [Gammaproteobacteria bacterium]MDH4254616.1 adenosylcobalamin-dependent ribonucleoside-diphosphate reductase [Gammaproteobacteria bacterium]MDH5310974.1 adenosylcobalamin-dependent ribonucleoside-diphosphate reductase [Gammaproteobacteria bacterium]
MNELQHYIWQTKYRAGGEDGIEDTWRRVARCVAAVERDAPGWEARFGDELGNWRFLPGGRIIAGAGTARQVTLFNCFAAGRLDDSLDGILDALKEAALTMQQGGGIGCDFSTLRPAGSPALRSGVIASGPVSFMKVWDAMCATLLSTSSRRGAMMATLRCDHPDVGAFVDAKRAGGVLRNFNLSVLVTDTFMRAVEDDAEWTLAFPPGSANAARKLPARELWQGIASAAHESAEPGVLFIDRINRDNNLWYCETISTTNPCGEIPLPPHGACDLGSLNLARFVRQPFTPAARIDEEAVASSVATAVRFLDDVIDASRFPLPAQADRARRTRRIGLGITGLADALIMCGLRYDSDAARATAASLLRKIRDLAYSVSVELARDKGAFPDFDRDRYLAGPFVQRLPDTLRDSIARNGIRNSHLLAIAPTGTISLLAGNVSSGIEPVFALEADREVIGPSGVSQTLTVRDYAYAAWLDGNVGRPPQEFVTAEAMGAAAHLQMQAALQPFVDNAISKTVNLPGAASVADVRQLYERAWELGLKGCTVYRSGSLEGQVLKSRDEARCCPVDRG